MQGIKSIICLLISAGFLFILSACDGERSSSASGTVQLALTSSVDLNPTDAADPGSTDSIDTNPTEAVDSNPTEAVDSNPTEDMDTNPTEDGDTNPNEAVDTNPIETMDPAEVVISIKEVRAVPAGREGDEEGGLPLIVAYTAPKVVNIMELAFLQELLGEAVLSAGSYTQIRLILEANTDALSPANYFILADDPTQKIPLNTPSGQESGLKIVGGFAVESGETTTVVLEFDPARAVVQAGQSGGWQLKPTSVRVMQTGNLLPSYGTITGRVELEVTGEDGTVIPTPGNGTMVFAVPQGSDTAVATGAVNPEDGSFRLLLPPGSYGLEATAVGFQPFSSLPAVFEVAEGKNTDGGVIFLQVPIAQ